MNLLISAGLKSPPLHPVFGLDEDWNSSRFRLHHSVISTLHPVFGLDEDWNSSHLSRAADKTYCIQSSGWMRIGTGVWYLLPILSASLHPVFGLDEDWNYKSKYATLDSVLIASSLRAG